MSEELNFQAFFNARVREKGYTLERLSRVSGIALKHLENLSAGNLQGLPAVPYLHGYLVKLGTILEFDAEGWWTRIKQAEIDIKDSGARDELPRNRYATTPFKKAWLAGGGVLLLLGLYGIFRFPAIVGEPLLVVIDPAQSPTSVSVNEFSVTGTLANGTSLTVNRSKVPVQADGSWRTTILLNTGLNTIEIKASKFLGREVTVIKQIIYEPTPSADESPTGALPAATPENPPSAPFIAPPQLPTPTAPPSF